jgi:Skp family chaperone for outer membrane proteins
MRKFVLITVCLLAVTLAAPAWAGKVGFVDLQRVLDLTTQGQEISKQISTKQDDAKIGLKKMELEFVTLRDNYEKTKDALAPEAKAGKEKELQQKYMILQQAAQKAQYDIEGYKLENFRQVIAKIKEITNTLAQSKGYDLVLLKVEDVMTEGSVVLFGAKSVDLTDEVIRQMNQ